MTRARRPRARAGAPGVIQAIRTGEPIEWSAKNWNVLIAAYYLREYHLSAPEERCARRLLDKWSATQREHEERERQGLLFPDRGLGRTR